MVYHRHRRHTRQIMCQYISHSQTVWAQKSNYRHRLHIVQYRRQNTALTEWRTPHKTGKASPVIPCHLTMQQRRIYQYFRSLTKIKGTFFLISFRNRPLRRTLPKALLASKKAQQTFEPWLLKCLMASVNVKRAVVQLLFFLKPNCNGSLYRKLSYSLNRTSSNSLETRGQW